MTPVWVVFEIYSPLYENKEYKNLDKVFAYREKAEFYVQCEQERHKLDGLNGYSYEIQETVFDVSV
jgi:hypothetical protein